MSGDISHLFPEGAGASGRAILFHASNYLAAV